MTSVFVRRHAHACERVRARIPNACVRVRVRVRVRWGACACELESEHVHMLQVRALLWERDGVDLQRYSSLSLYQRETYLTFAFVRDPLRRYWGRKP